MAYLERMQEALLLSESMLKSAEAGDWDMVVEIENRRQAIFTRELTLPDGDKEAALARNTIASILEINQQVTDLAEQNLSASRNELGNWMNKGKKAVNAYTR